MEILVWLVGPFFAACLTPFDAFFLYNFLFVFAPQLVILSVLRGFTVAQPVRLGVSCTLALVPVLIYLMFWVFSWHDWWWTYIRLLPGAFVGAFVAARWSSDISKRTRLGALAAASLAVVSCLFANALGVLLFGT